MVIDSLLKKSVRIEWWGMRPGLLWLLLPIITPILALAYSLLAEDWILAALFALLWIGQIVFFICIWREPRKWAVRSYKGLSVIVCFPLASVILLLVTCLWLLFVGNGTSRSFLRKWR